MLTPIQQATADRELADWHRLSAMVAFANEHKLLLSANTNWRMLPDDEQRPGQIHALPGSHGIVRATNGVYCLIEQPGKAELFLGHIDNWVPDKEHRASTGTSRRQMPSYEEYE